MLVLTRKIRREDRGHRDMVFLYVEVEKLEEYLACMEGPRRNFEEILIQVGALRSNEGKILFDAPEWMGILRGEKIEKLRWDPQPFARSLKESGEFILLKLWRGDLRKALVQAKSRRNRTMQPFVVLAACWFVKINEGECSIAIATPLPRLDVSHSLWPTAGPSA